MSDGETLVGSKLSDDYGNAVVNKRSLQLRHLVFDIVLSIIAVGIAIGIRTGIAFTPIVPHFSPTLIFVHHCELIGIIEVNFHHQTTGMFVVQLRIIVVLYCLVDIGFWTLNHQYAIFVITACGTHSIDKGLLIFSQTACQLIVSNILAVGFGIPMFLLMPKIVVLLGAEGEELIYNAVLYGRVYAAGMPAFMLQMAFQPFFMAAEKPSSVQVM